jgi:hypothetical protein
MVDRTTAEKLVIEFVNSEFDTAKNQDENVIISDLTIEKDYGWIFFYNSRRYLETQDVRYALFGNAPIIVEKENGSLHFTGTAEEIDYYIKRYERQRRWRKWLRFLEPFKHSKSM